MGYKVEYAGLPLHNYLDILNIKRQILPSRENFTKNIPGVHGEYYTGYKYSPRLIVLECVLKSKSREEYVDNINQLAYILDVKKPQKLIASDAPNVYNYAVVEGDIDAEKIKNNAKIQINFMCYDPTAFSIESDYFYGDAKSKVTLNNSGNQETYPIVSVAFNNTSHFLQCTNPFGETVLVGLPPSVDNTNASFDPVVLKDECNTLQNWNPVGNIVDNAIVDGDMTINGGGYAIISSNFGSGDGWHGPAKRKNFRSVSSFCTRVKIEHSSQGDYRSIGAGPEPPVSPPPTPEQPNPSPVKYKVNASPSLRIREGRGTSTKQIGSIPNGKVVDVSNISGGWGKITYNGVTGYISMEYTMPYNGDNSIPSSTYKCTASPSVRIRSGRGTNYKQVGSLPNGKQTQISDIADNWGKITYNGITGYVSMQYMSPVNNSRISPFADEDNNDVTKEDRIGKVEIYGYDTNGVKLFKMSMRDNSEWYEYSEPEIQIGNNIVLDDNKTVPSPKTISQTEDEKTVIKKIDSGAFGDWNNFNGWFTIQRLRKNDTYVWSCRVEKLGSNGSVERTIESNNLSNSSYPTGDLTNIVIFFGQYGQNIPVDVMNVANIDITDIGEPPKPKENKPLFKNGDELIVDFNTQKIQLNSLPIMNNLDIGSQFFSIPVGSSQLICASDDKQIDVEVSLQKRWI